jgi:hypothetical protein
MKALVISKFFPPTRETEAPLTGKFVAVLADAGVRSEIICEAPGDGLDNSPIWEKLGPEPHRLLEKRRIIPLRFLRPWAKAYFGYYGWLTYWTAMAHDTGRRLIRRQRPDVLLSWSNPDESTVVGHALWRRYGIRWTAYFGDPPLYWYPPPFPEAPGTWLMKPMSLKWLRRVMPRIPLVTMTCRRQINYYIDKLGINIAHNSFVKPHIAWRYTPPPDEAAPAGGPVRIMHLGAVTSVARSSAAVHFLQAFRDATADLRGCGGAVELVFVGDQDPAILAAVRDLRLEDHVRVMPPVSQEDSLRLMTEATGLLLVEQEFEEGIILPAKFVDYAASGKPVLMFSPEVGTISDIVGGHAHPGFLGQAVEGAAAALHRFLNDCSAGRDLSAYTVPADD